MSEAQPRTGATTRSPRVAARREHIRDQLVKAGGHLFAERGPAQVSVEDILTEVNISRRTFYTYFANKFELLAGVINPALEDGTEMLEAVCKQPPQSMLSGIVDCYRGLWESHSDALIITSALDPAIMPYVESQHRKFGAALKKSLQQAEQAGSLRNDDAVYTFKIISRTAVPLLKIYADHPQGSELYRDAMLALLSDES